MAVADSRRTALTSEPQSTTDRLLLLSPTGQGIRASLMPTICTSPRASSVTFLPYRNRGTGYGPNLSCADAGCGIGASLLVGCPIFHAFDLQHFQLLLHRPLEFVQDRFCCLRGRQLRGDPASVAEALAQLADSQCI